MADTRVDAAGIDVEALAAILRATIGALDVHIQTRAEAIAAPRLSQSVIPMS